MYMGTNPATSPSIVMRTCCGSHPVDGDAHFVASSDWIQACSRNGEDSAKLDGKGDSVSAGRSSADATTHAFHASAGTSSMDAKSSNSIVRSLLAGGDRFLLFSGFSVVFFATLFELVALCLLVLVVLGRELVTTALELLFRRGDDDIDDNDPVAHRR
jgi:hypothetical protein